MPNKLLDKLVGVLDANERVELTVDVCASHLRWVLAVSQLVDFLVYISNAAMECRTRKKLQGRSVYAAIYRASWGSFTRAVNHT